VFQELLSFLPHEPVPDKFLGPVEDPRILRGERLVPEQQVPLLHLERVIVALDQKVPLRPPELQRHRRVDAEGLVNHGLHQRHVLHRRHRDLPAGVSHGGANLLGQARVELHPRPSDPLDDVGEEQLHPAEGVEAGGEQEIVASLVARDSQSLCLVEDGGGRGVEEVVESLVVFLDEGGGEAEGANGGFFQKLGEAQPEDRAQLEENPFLNYLWAVAAQFGVGGVGGEERPGEEVERGLVVGVAEAGFSGFGEVGLELVEEVFVGGVELRDDVVASGLEEEEDELLEEGVFGFGGVEVGEDSVTAGEVGGGHVGSGENIFFLDLGGVEEDGEALSVEENDDVWFEGDEGTRRHVGAEDR